jgi:hypothetical protein
LTPLAGAIHSLAPVAGERVGVRVQNLAEPLSTGERFASWSAVALYRFGTGRETLASTLHPAPTGWFAAKNAKTKKAEGLSADNFPSLVPPGTDANSPVVKRKLHSRSFAFIRGWNLQD